MKTAIPQTETELLHNANNLAGKSIANVAKQFKLNVPTSLIKKKGWVGQLLEIALGATAKSKAEPDFQKISVELKTLPLNDKQQPKESTFVCTVPQHIALEWRRSHVWQKLKRVLWVPIEADEKIPIAERRIGQAILWSPDQAQERILKQDWLELSEMLTLGQYAELTAKHGTYLQCRPKAAHSRILRHDIDQQGKANMIVPRGFYLRPILTKMILRLGC